MNTPDPSPALPEEQAIPHNRQRCAACGWPFLRSLQRSSTGVPSGEECPACAFVAGVSDDKDGFSYEQWRELWVAKGLPWSSTEVCKPKSWNPIRLLQALNSRRRPVIPPHYMQRTIDPADKRPTRPRRKRTQS